MFGLYLIKFWTFPFPHKSHISEFLVFLSFEYLLGLSLLTD